MNKKLLLVVGAGGVLVLTAVARSPGRIVIPGGASGGSSVRPGMVGLGVGSTVPGVPGIPGTTVPGVGGTGSPGGSLPPVGGGSNVPGSTMPGVGTGMMAMPTPAPAPVIPIVPPVPPLIPR